MQGYINCNTYDLRRENPCVSGEKKSHAIGIARSFQGGLGFRGKITSPPLPYLAIAEFSEDSLHGLVVEFRRRRAVAYQSRAESDHPEVWWQ